MSSREDICSEIDNAFSEFVDEAEDVRNKLLEVSKENSYQIRKTREAFNTYLEGEGAEGDMLKNMVDCGIRMLKEQISPNKTTLFPRAAGAAKKGGLTAKKPADSSTSSTSTTKTASSTAASAPAKKGKAKKEKDGPKRINGFNLFQASIADELKELHPDNPTARSKEAGNRWRQLKKDDPDRVAELNAEGERLTQESGYVPPPSKKKAKEAGDRRPIQARQVFHREQYEKYKAEFCKKPFRMVGEGDDKTQDFDNPEWKEGDSVPPKYVMVLTAQAWNNLKPAQQAKYEKMAAEQNEREGRHHKEKSKGAADSLKPTNGRRLFEADFREQHESEYENYYAMAGAIKAVWDKMRDGKTDEWQEWQDKAKEENARRAKLREQAEADAAVGDEVEAES